MKVFIFDMDGTIINNTPYHTKAWLRFLSNNKILIKEEELGSKIYGVNHEIIPRFFGNHLSIEKIKSLAAEKEKIYRTLYQPLIEELKGLKKLLILAKQKKISVALATMSNVDNISFIIDSLGIRSYFDFIAGEENVKQGKPLPEIYELVLSTIKIKPEDAVVFEDSPTGVKSAQQAGIDVIGICTSHSKDEFKKWGVNISINNFEEYIDNYFID